MAKKNYPLVNLLISLKESENRGKLATLRSGASDPYNNFEALSIIGNLIPDGKDESFKNAMLLSTLFSIHPLHTENRNIGEGLKYVRNRLTVGGESLDARFLLLLNSDHQDLPHNLLQICRFLANKEIAIDYHQLFEDLRFWTHQEKRVQLRWARGYWAFQKDEQENEDINQDKNNNSDFLKNNEETL